MFLIVGAGNILLSDEGIGIHVIKDLEKEKTFKDTVFADLGTSSLDISSYFNRDVEKLAVIDCIKSHDNSPGTVLKLTIDDLRKRQVNNFSLHQIELVDSLKLNSLDFKVPDTLILGIVPHDTETFSTELSGKMKLIYPGILEKIRKELIIFLNKNA